MKSLIFFIFVIFSSTLNAMTVKSIDYKGIIYISKPVALRMLEFQVGDTISGEDIDKSIKAYFKQGYFQDITVDFDDGVLTYNFVEKPLISQVLLEGWKDNEEDEFKENILQIKKGSVYNEAKIEMAKKRIIEAINQEGKVDSVVEVEKEHLDNGSIKLTFVVNEGEEIIIESLNYHGVKGLDSDDFDDVIANKEHEFMGWFFGRNDGKMKLLDLKYDNLRIKDYYMQYGYLDAEVDYPFTRVNFDNYTADMSYQVDEGPQYKISKISIDQVKEVIDEAKVREVITLEKGEVFNIKTFRENSEKIKTLVADLSYAYVQVQPDLRKNKDDDTVEVVFKIIPGERVKIRDVFISGNNRTLDRIVRRELYLGPGDMYSLTDLKDSRTALGRLGFFEANTIEEKRVNASTMDLIVKVKEAPTGNIQIGGGYGSYGGLLVNLSVNDSNIWGSGISLGVQIERSTISNSLSFNIANSRLNDSDFSGNFGVYSNSIEYNDYTVDSIGLNFGTGHRLTRHITAYLGYGFSNNKYVVDANTTLELDPVFFDSYEKSSVTLSVKYDDTDDFYLPRSGMLISQSIEYAGFNSQAKFIKSRTSFNKYLGLEEYIGMDIIARYKARYNHVEDDGYVPIAEKFYMGGIGSVRGFESYSLSPTNTSSSGTIRRIGAAMTFSNSAELSFPLIPSAKMRLVAYVDYGFIGEDTLDEIDRGGYGLGLEWFSPVGPIQLMMARPINEQAGDRTNSFEFTMGQRF